MVGLDPEELVREYDAVHGAPHEITAADVFEPSTPIRLKERRSANWSVVMVVVLALVLGYGVYRLVDHGASPRPVAASGWHPKASTSPAAWPSPTPTAAPHPHRLVIRLTATQDCWVEFTRPHGQFLFQVYVLGGSTRTWHFKHAVSMQIGNPGGIELTVNGRNLGHPGTYGRQGDNNSAPGKSCPGPLPASRAPSGPGHGRGYRSLPVCLRVILPIPGGVRSAWSLSAARGTRWTPRSWRAGSKPPAGL